MNKKYKLSPDTIIVSDTHFYHRNILKYEPIRGKALCIENIDEHDDALLKYWNDNIKEDDNVLHLGDLSFGIKKDTKELKDFLKTIPTNVNVKTIKNIIKHKNITSFDELSNAIKDTDISGSSNHDALKSLLMKTFYAQRSIISELNGNITLILGNHDKSASKYDEFNNITVIDGFNLGNGKHIKNEDSLLSGFIIEYNGKKIMFCHYALFNNDDFPRKEHIVNRVNYLESLFKEHKCDFLIHGHAHSNPCDFNYSHNASIEVNRSIMNGSFGFVKFKDIFKHLESI